MNASAKIKYILPRTVNIENPLLFPFFYYECVVLFIGESTAFQNEVGKSIELNGREIYISDYYKWFDEKYKGEELELIEIENEKCYIIAPKTEEGNGFVLHSLLIGVSIKVCGNIVREEG